MKSILTLNAGSSSIKFAAFEIREKKLIKVFAGLVDSVLHEPILTIKNVISGEKIALELSKLSKNSGYTDPYERAMHDILDWLQAHQVDIIAAGHRVAHGGTRYRQAIPVSLDAIEYLKTVSSLAPLHNPYNLRGSEVMRGIYPDLFQAFCFDTAFHTTCNPLSQRFAIPKYLHEEGVRRYGFHGLSYEYIVSQFDQYLPKEKADGRIIIAHLGAGASMCAVKARKSVATTLSFSALDGLPMGTRCGNIDPGVLLYLMSDHQMNYDRLMKLLYKESGLLGLSNGISSDMRQLTASDSEDAKLAIDVFAYKIAGWVGMLAAELEGLDGVIFTAGIGENSSVLRRKVCERAGWLGAKLDVAKNEQNQSTIHTQDSKLALHIIPTDEERIIAEHTYQLLSG